MEDVKNYKSFLIIRELLEKIYKIDDYQFPNDDAKKAKSLLINILKAVLSVPSNYEIDEESLFNFVTNLDLIIFHLENCNTNKLNWAIVGYSDWPDPLKLDYLEC